METYSPACDLQTKQFVWSLFKNGFQAKFKNEPIVASAARISHYNSVKYAF